ncbi:nose resistant to fluoxetine protein 6-like isoform X2 [Rhynchophorus ferrugineus]|uniref:nose resistant to fluoxetine protein 6-like isoform X2 n=1 Tax=Rhynchophorus ferrugineus TaxID=354439 RepID=UPI003FCDAB2C
MFLLFWAFIVLSFAMTRSSLNTNYNSVGSVINSSILTKIVNKSCSRDLNLIQHSLLTEKISEFYVFEATLTTSLESLHKDYYRLGKFDDCVDLKYQYENGMILGQYCLADLNFKYEINIMDPINTPKERNKFKDKVHWGLCFPASCSRQDINNVLSTILSHQADVVINEKSCYYHKSDKISTGDIIYGSIIAFFVTLITLCTVLHVIHLKRRLKKVIYNVDTIRRQNVSTKYEIVISFSVVHTVMKLLHTKPSELNLECICGIKLLTMVLIIAGHSLIFVFSGPVSNIEFFQQNSYQLQNSIFLNNPLLVDSFLLISGFLTCYLMLIELQKRHGQLNIWFIYLARYIRLTPAYLTVIGFYMTWFPKIGSGPLWRQTVEVETERCLKSWWTNLLYINNYVNTDYLCIFQAWYLAVDYQLFIIAPLIILSIWKWKIWGKALFTILILTLMLLPSYFTIKNNLDPTLLVFPSEIEDISTNVYFNSTYIKTHIRAISYFCGILLGYVIHRLQINGNKISTNIRILGWIITTILGTASMFSIIVFYQKNYEFDKIESSIYTGCHRIAWNLFISWVITVCVTENSPFINKFLSWKAFVPLSRLTYCAYLTNGIIEIYHKGTIKQELTLTKFDLTCRLLGHLGLTFGLAFILCICFESPIHCLEKILLRKEGLIQNLQTSPDIFKIPTI